MDIFRRLLYIISGVFILICLLLVLNVISREFFLQNFGMVNIESVYNTLLIIGLFLLGLMMLVHGMTTAALRDDLRRAENRANDLKARLYDLQQADNYQRMAARNNLPVPPGSQHLPSNGTENDPYSTGPDQNLHNSSL